MSDCLLHPIREKAKVLNCDTCVPGHSGLERIFFSAKPTTSCSQDVDLSDFVLFLKIKSELWTQWKIHKNTVLKVAQCFK